MSSSAPTSARKGNCMANEKRLIDAYALEEAITVDYYEHFTQCHDTDQIALIDMVREDIGNAPTVDAVEVVHGYHPGDVCIYGFHKKNKSLAIVEIVKILNDERGIAEVKFLKVFVDDTGNGMFNYLLRSGKTMNASFCYLKNITPIGAKMDGDGNG